MIIIGCFISCSTSKNNNNFEEDLIKKTIDNYILDFKNEINQGRLEAIIIYVGKEGIEKNISISDAPKEIINASKNKQNKLIGNYKNIVFELYGIENFNYQKINKNEDSDFNILEQSSTMGYDAIPLEYNPSLIIEYDYRNKSKKLRLLNGQIKSLKWAN
jgi:hypothetical protein